MNDILNDVFEVSGKLEITQEVINILIDMVECSDASTIDGAALLASQQNSISALLHISLDYVFDARMALDELQNRKECVA